MCGRGYLVHQPVIEYIENPTKEEHDTERSVWPDGTPAPSVRFVNKRTVPTDLHWKVWGTFDFFNCGYDTETSYFTSRREAEKLVEKWMTERCLDDVLPTYEEWHDDWFGE